MEEMENRQGPRDEGFRPGGSLAVDASYCRGIVGVQPHVDASRKMESLEGYVYHDQLQNIYVSSLQRTRPQALNRLTHGGVCPPTFLGGVGVYVY